MDPEGYLAQLEARAWFACQFANDVFDAPRGGIGLQLRCGSGPPIGEQVSWVGGPRRIVVGLRQVSAPPDHSSILRLVAPSP
jgi:hypothetical protein